MKGLLDSSGGLFLCLPQNVRVFEEIHFPTRKTRGAKKLYLKIGLILSYIEITFDNDYR